MSFFRVGAQFRSAELSAAGLTCALCSNAIHKSLTTLKFIEKVDVDLKRSAFLLVFRSGERIDFENIRRKVEDAGFSVASLNVNADFPKINIQPGMPVELGGISFCFRGAKQSVIDGNYTITFIEPGFLTDKFYKKYKKQFSKEEECIFDRHSKIYHVMFR